MIRNVTRETVEAAARRIWPDARLVESTTNRTTGWRVVIPLGEPNVTETVAYDTTLEALLGKIEREAERLGQGQ